MNLLLFSGNRRAASPSPSLDMNFTSGALPAACTFSRASAGTMFNSAGTLVSQGADVARFGYVYDAASSSWKAGGLLYEAQKTNFVRQSNSIVSPWTPYNVTPTSDETVLSPSGTSAVKLSGTGGIYQGITTTSGVANDWSAFLKAGTVSLVRIGTTENGDKFAVFDLTTGALVSTSGDVTGTHISNCGNGWFRCGMTRTTASTTNNVFVFNHSGSTGSWYVAEIQSELGSAPSSAIRTTSSTVTRAADQLSFAIPSGVQTLRYTFDDDSTQDVSATSGSYVVPTNLHRAFIKRIHSL